MLKASPFKKGDVVTLKLISGEELLGSFIDDDDNHITVKNPSVLGADPKGGMGLFPWLISATNDTAQIKHTTIAVVAETGKEIGDKFREATSDIAIVTP